MQTLVDAEQPQRSQRPSRDQVLDIGCGDDFRPLDVDTFALRDHAGRAGGKHVAQPVGAGSVRQRDQQSRRRRDDVDGSFVGPAGLAPDVRYDRRLRGCGPRSCASPSGSSPTGSSAGRRPPPAQAAIAARPPAVPTTPPRHRSACRQSSRPLAYPQNETNRRRKGLVAEYVEPHEQQVDRSRRARSIRPGRHRHRRQHRHRLRSRRRARRQGCARRAGGAQPRQGQRRRRPDQGHDPQRRRHLAGTRPRVVGQCPQCGRRAACELSAHRSADQQRRRDVQRR